MYKIVFTPGAEKDLKYLHKANKSVFIRIENAIHSLAEDPMQGRSLKFSLKDLRSYRVGTYRVIYSIERAILTIRILDIGHRREVHR